MPIRGTVTGEGPRGTAGVLRLSGRALRAMPDDEPDRERLRDSAFSECEDARLSEPQADVRDRTSAGALGTREMAQAGLKGRVPLGVGGQIIRTPNSQIPPAAGRFLTLIAPAGREVGARLPETDCW